MALPLVPIIFLAAGAFLLGKRKKGEPCPDLYPTGGVLNGVRYKEFVTGGADPNEALPMIIVFHGRSVSLDHFMPTLTLIKDPARIIMPEGPECNGKYCIWFEEKAKTENQEALANQIKTAVDNIAPFISTMARCRPTIGRPIVAGHSQGAMMALGIATLKPQLISAAIPAAGWLPKSLWSARTAPIYAVHARGDMTMPFDWMADWAAKMAQLGANQIFFREVTGSHKLSGVFLSTWIGTIRYTLRRGVEQWSEM